MHKIDTKRNKQIKSNKFYDNKVGRVITSWRAIEKSCFFGVSILFSSTITIKQFSARIYDFKVAYWIN